MTIEQLNDRIAKKQKDIEKINKRIAKWSKGLRPEDIAICKVFENCYYGDKPRTVDWRNFKPTPEYSEARANYNAYLKEHDKDIPRADDWNKGPNIGELYSAYRDLGEANHTLKKYEDMLTNLNNFEKVEKVEVIWNFLMAWKERTRDWYRKNCQRFFELKKNKKEAYEKFKEENKDKSNFDILDRYWKRDYYSSIDSLTEKLTHFNYDYIYPDPNWKWNYESVLASYTIDEKLLEETLAKEVKAKYERLIADITHITGEITDASYLSIGAEGDINGLVKGVNGTASVNTFSAGGYNIQCFHYRTKITRIKESN